MSIPTDISKFHIAKAIKELSTEPFMNEHGSTKYCVHVEGKALEVKRIISRAALIANKRDLLHKEFDSTSAKKYLEMKGFKVDLGATK